MIELKFPFTVNAHNEIEDRQGQILFTVRGFAGCGEVADWLCRTLNHTQNPNPIDAVVESVQDASKSPETAPNSVDLLLGKVNSTDRKKVEKALKLFKRLEKKYAEVPGETEKT